MARETPAAPGAAPETSAAPAARVMKVHHLRPAPGAKTAKTRVGRGEASKGKTAGRGTKGSKARYQVSAAFEGGQMPLHMRLPKLRGFTNPFKVTAQAVNLSQLKKVSATEVSPETLYSAGLIAKVDRPVKLLGTGDADRSYTVRGVSLSASARAKIEAAGGKIEG